MNNFNNNSGINTDVRIIFNLRYVKSDGSDSDPSLDMSKFLHFLLSFWYHFDRDRRYPCPSKSC